MNDIAISVSNLSKCYQIYDSPRDRLKQFVIPRLRRFVGCTAKKYFREFWALKDVSFEVKRGETVGIVGRNGSGKSTLLQMICGTLSPEVGTIQTYGRIAALLELGSGFNPEFSGRENVYMNASVLGLTRDEINLRFDDIVAFADIGEFIEQPVRSYSSGMMVRLAFAVAINVEPDILIVDEALAVGDAAFQRKCMRKINELSDNGVTLLFVSHDIETVRKICSRAIYFNRGVMLGIGSAKDVCIEYERDLFGAAKGIDAPSSKDADKAEQSECGALDPELLSVSEKVYGDGRVQILDIEIKNEYKQKINVLEPGIDVFISYRAKFLEFSEFPVFGMMLTNREGVCVFGTNTQGQILSARRYSAGDELIVKFHLTNNLGPGIYYLTCGVHSGEGSDGLIYLQRRMDVLMLKSIVSEGLNVGGTSNLHPRIEGVFAGGDLQ
ncbi:ABC transporter ATP-binding protein [Pseudomonas protegens]|uniref:ABC transporter ATP-binding protein n=1 Tax=Pseudomonas protegens TaxID=380021 RepID=UPI00215EB4F9|nr:ABC transporter ATP-binding protein [Pseudomonas protegens]UVM10368.1 ABC transporter ATP-binding protein [Pseudomonas protegens]